MTKINIYPIVSKPNVYITPDLIEGEQCAIHIVGEKQTFLTLKFEEGSPDVPYKPFLSADKQLDISAKPKLKKQIATYEDRIVDLGGVYTCYSYLLTVRDNMVFLLSVTIGGLSLGFEITKQIANKIDIPVYNSIWNGMYTSHISNAFVEDIFIQKK